MNTKQTTLTLKGDSYSICFNAMASPCEVIIQTKNKTLAMAVADIVSAEVWRIEQKFSRYTQNSLCTLINDNAGKSVTIDEETFLLLSFADQCYQLSDGLFDITSGVLRKLWSFDCLNYSDTVLPNKNQIDDLLANIGWPKVKFDQNQITLLKGMEIDFGGLGKEYAVDRSIILVKALTDKPVLINLGGDLAVTCPRHYDKAWKVAIENPDIASEKDDDPDMIISLKAGALATSGDARKYFIKDGQRYGHILNPKDGRPILQAPRSLTVVAPHCIQAGMLATLGLLKGVNAESFLTCQEIKFWSRR